MIDCIWGLQNRGEIREKDVSKYDCTLTLKRTEKILKKYQTW